MASLRNFFIIVIFFALGNESIHAYHVCESSLGEVGACIPLKKCDHFIKIVELQESIFYPYLRKNKCFAEGNHIYICCPLSTMNTTALSRVLLKVGSINTFEESFDAFPENSYFTGQHNSIDVSTATPSWTNQQDYKPLKTPKPFSHNPFLNFNYEIKFEKPSPDREDTTETSSTKTGTDLNLKKDSKEQQESTTTATPNSTIPFMENPFLNLHYQSKLQEPIQTSTEQTERKDLIREKHSHQPIDLPEKAQLPQPPICGRISDDAIYSGSASQLTESPWAAIIEGTNGSSNRILCAGSLISDQFIVSSAHCFDSQLNKGWKPFQVRLGEWDILRDPDCSIQKHGHPICADRVLKIEVESISWPPEYHESKQKHDIALIKLVKPVQFTSFIRPICLYRPNGRTFTNLKNLDMTVIGWDKHAKQYPDTVKQKATVQMVDTKQCSDNYQLYNLNIYENQVCVIGNTSNSCIADFLVFDISILQTQIYYLAGISTGEIFGCESLNDPMIYLKIESYYDWILERIAA